MAYNPLGLHLLVRGGGTVGINVWVLDTVDATASVDTAGYISDGGNPLYGGKGMEKGDLVLVRRWTTTIPAATSEKRTAAGSANILLEVYWHTVMGISVTTAAVDLGDGLAVPVTNTD